MSQRLWIADGGPPADVEEGSVLFMGAAVVLQCGGFTVLVDPTFLNHGDHVHLGYGPTARPLEEPGIGAEQLPPADFVLLSHLHHDPFAREVERELDRRLPILTTPRAAKALPEASSRPEAPPWSTVSVERADAAVA
jgi:L-ascorbate metabolism protein UlaG (beta-lactamase superfamily)